MRWRWLISAMLWVTTRIWTRLSSQTHFSPGGVTAASKMFTLSGSAKMWCVDIHYSSKQTALCTWIDWWLTDCVSRPVSEGRRPVVLPGHSALTVPHQVPQAAFSSQVHIAAFARLVISNRVFAPVLCKPWRWPVSIFPHLVKSDNHQSETCLRMLTIGTGGPLGTGAGSLGKGGAVGSQPAPSCSPTWWSSRLIWNIWGREIGRLVSIAKPEKVEIVKNLRDWSWLSLAHRLEPVASLPGFPWVEESTWTSTWCQVQDYPESIFTCLLLVPPQAWSWLLLGFHRFFSRLWSVTEPQAERHLEKRLSPLRIWLEESLPEGPPSCLTLSASNYWCLAQTGECNPAMALQPRRLMGGWNARWSPSHLKASDSRPPDKHHLDSSPALSKLNSPDHLYSLVLGFNFPSVLSFARKCWLWYKPRWSALT